MGSQLPAARRVLLPLPCAWLQRPSVGRSLEKPPQRQRPLPHPVLLLVQRWVQQQLWVLLVGWPGWQGEPAVMQLVRPVPQAPLLRLLAVLLLLRRVLQLLQRRVPTRLAARAAPGVLGGWALGPHA